MVIGNMATPDFDHRDPLAPVAYPVSYEPSASSAIDLKLRQIYHAFRRNVRLIMLIVLGCMGLGVVITMMLKPKYTAQSRVMVEQASAQIIKDADVEQLGKDPDTDRFLQTQIQTIESRSLAERVVESEKLARDPRFYAAMGAEMPAARDAGLRAAADILLNNLTVSLIMNSRIIEIGFTTRDPAMSARLANAFAANYIQNNLSIKFDSSRYARTYLSDQLELTRNRLEQSERQLNEYSRAAGLIRVTGQSDGTATESAVSVTNDSLDQLSKAANEATAERIAAENMWKTIAKQPVLSITPVINNQAVQSLLSERAEMEGRLADERSRHLEDYPTVKALKAQIASVSARIDSIGQSIKRSVQIDYEASVDKEKSFKGQVNQLRGSALDEQDRGVHYNVLKRIADTNRTLYDSLLERYNQVNANAGSTSNNISLIDSANIPLAPSSPHLFFNLIISLLIGSMLGGLVVYIRETFDDNIREPADVETKLGKSLLGLIPLVVEDDTSAILDNPKSPMSEAYHTLVANLRYATSHGLPTILGVTSAGEGEGKSTTSWAIAMNIAQLGKSVLIIDADLRRPNLQQRLAVRPASGLTDVLIGQITLDAAIVPSHIENLSCLTALPIPPNPSMLLAGGNLARVIDEAKGKYDHIVLDCPPLLGISDTASVAPLCDGVLFMVDASSFHRGAVKSALRRLTLIHANVLGIALSKFDAKGAAGDYDYYAYNYYSYGQSEKAS